MLKRCHLFLHSVPLEIQKSYLDCNLNLWEVETISLRQNFIFKLFFSKLLSSELSSFLKRWGNFPIAFNSLSLFKFNYLTTVRYCVQTFPSCCRWGLLFSCSAWVPLCGDFSCCRAWALECVGFSSCGTWLSCPAAYGIFPGRDLRDQTCVPAWQVDY